MSVDKVETGNARPLLAKVRMADLARMAGVSVATVSRSLADSPLINRVTKNRVWQIACDHGYLAVHDIPEAVRSSHATVALMVPPGASGDLHDLMSGLIEAAREMRCDLLISHLGKQWQSDLPGALRKTGADAFVFLGDKAMQEALCGLGAGDTRFIVWGDTGTTQSYAGIGPDNLAGGALATRYLIERGCRRIAYLGDTEGAEMTQRFMGYLTALNDANIRFDPALLLQVPLARPADYDGLFVASESKLPFALEAASDDVQAIAWHGGRSTLPIMSVSTDMAAAGRRILSILLGATGAGADVSEKIPVILNGF